MDGDENIKKRISLINNFDYKEHKSLVKTEITEEENKYIYKQKHLKVKRITQLKKSDFFDLSDSLEYFSRIDFVHADLNRKNIIYTEDGFKIIDYEPSIKQIKNNVEQLMVTIPYVIKDELKSKVITKLTDKIGYYYFILRVNGNLSSMDVVKLSKTLRHKNKIDRCFVDFNYGEILDYAYN